MSQSELPSETSAPERSLDPEDWDAMRALGHRMVDDMFQFLSTVRERDTWRPVPQATKDFFRGKTVPTGGQSPESIYEEFREQILPHALGNIHPRFWGWVIGTGTPLGALADMLASAMNPNSGGFDQGATYVEFQVLDWLKEMMGFPSGSSGLLVSGGSMANLVGLAVARNARAEVNLPQQGLAAAPRRMVLYASSETHNSVHKAAALLGLGRDGVRSIPVDGDYRIQLPALRAAVKADRAAGLHPFCVVANAGTVNTGATDDLNAIADLCAKEGLWMHVDGAFGAMAVLAPETRSVVAGMDRADSVAFDLHKWMYMPYEVGCVLVRDAAAHRASFAASASYLAHLSRGTAGVDHLYSDYGVQLSRGFRSLKVWMSLKEHGVERYGRQIFQNVQQARYLAELVEAERELELTAPTALNITCFRFVGKKAQGVDLNALNEELLMSVQEDGVAVPSSTTLHGKLSIRVCICNHRSRREDFDLLVREVLRRGRALESRAL